MKIGLIVAIETNAVFDRYKTLTRIEGPKGFDVFRTENGGNEVYIVHTGMGEIAASAGVQYLVTAFGVEVIVNFGVVGGLTEQMKKQKTCIVDRVVHYKYDCSEFLELEVGQVDGHSSIFLPTSEKLVEKAISVCPDLVKATCCSGDKFVSSSNEKNHLHLDFEGDVCDMESAGIVLACEINNIPCILLKAVSDGLSGGAREFYAELNDAGALCLNVADKVISALAE